MNITEAIEVLGSVRRHEEALNDKINKLCVNPAVSIGAEAIDIALTALHEKLERENQPDGWVPVSERLPALTSAPYARAECLGVINGRVYPVLYRRDPEQGEFWSAWYRSELADTDVTHWRYLPAPPKEDNR